METFIDVGFNRFLIRGNGNVYEICKCSCSCRCVPELLDSRAGKLAKEVARLTAVIEGMKKDEQEAEFGFRKPTTCESSLSKLGLPTDPPFQVSETKCEGFSVPTDPQAISESTFENATPKAARLGTRFLGATADGPLPQDTGHP